jgi:hypothetical protein
LLGAIYATRDPLLIRIDWYIFHLKMAVGAKTYSVYEIVIKIFRKKNTVAIDGTSKDYSVFHIFFSVLLSSMSLSFCFPRPKGQKLLSLPPSLAS